MSVEGFNYDNILIRMLNRLGDAVVLSVVFVLFSLPVVTIGASITALYYTAMKGLTKDDGYVWKYFVKSFKENIKQSTLIWLLSIVVLFVLGVDVWFWFSLRDTSGFSINNIMLIISIVILSLAVMTEIYVYPLQAKFDNTIKVQIRNAFLLSIKYFPTTIIVALIMAVVAWAFYYQPALAVVGFILIGFGAVGYLFGYMMLKCLKPYLPEETPLGSDEDFSIGGVEKSEPEFGEVDDEEENETNDKTDDNEDKSENDNDEDIIIEEKSEETES